MPAVGTQELQTNDLPSFGLPKTRLSWIDPQENPVPAVGSPACFGHKILGMQPNLEQ